MFLQIFAQQFHVPMNRYEAWVLVVGIIANLILTVRSQNKSAEAAKNAGTAVVRATVAATKVDSAMEQAEKRVNVIEGKIDDVRLTIDGGLKTMLETIRAEGFVAGAKDERMRASVGEPINTGQDANTAALRANTVATDANTAEGARGKP